MKEIIEINTDNPGQVDSEDDIYGSRAARAEYNTRGYESEVSILIQVYNELEKTKACVESVMKYSEGIDYDLWLIDNGSTDGTFEWFKTVEYDKLHILHLSENKGTAMPGQYFSVSMLGKYVVTLNGDLVMTENWLSNLLEVAKSDSKIGMVNPVSSNTSNFQNVELQFSDNDEMQRKAAEYNRSDPTKWNERLRLITLGTLYTKECLMAIGLPLTDPGFSHNFSDDDITFRVRRARYKAVLAADTWIHHDDNKKCLTPEAAERVNRDLDIGRKKFIDKYNGIDAWEDVNNFIFEYVKALNPEDGLSCANVLGIDVRCGTPILEIRNYLRQFYIFNAECFAYTTEAKYLTDLQTVCGAGNVLSGNIEGFWNNYGNEFFDEIVIGNDINIYHDPLRLIRFTMSLLKKKGQLFVSLQNTNHIFALLGMLGHSNRGTGHHAINYTVEEFMGALKESGYEVRCLGGRKFNAGLLTEDLEKLAAGLVGRIGLANNNEAHLKLCTERYYFVITK